MQPSRYNVAMDKAYSYRFYPTPAQAALLRRTLGCVRLVYNRMLAERTTAWQERQERVDYAQTSVLCVEEPAVWTWKLGAT